MSPKQTHAIHWKSTVTGGVGTGTNLFEQEEAERLATELNESYPEIDHQAVVALPSADSANAQPGQAKESEVICDAPRVLKPGSQWPNVSR